MENGKLWWQNAPFSKHNIFHFQLSIFHSPRHMAGYLELNKSALSQGKASDPSTADGGKLLAVCCTSHEKS
jgi:hypothetical protein